MLQIVYHARCGQQKNPALHRVAQIKDVVSQATVIVSSLIHGILYIAGQIGLRLLRYIPDRLIHHPLDIRLLYLSSAYGVLHPIQDCSYPLLRCVIKLDTW